MKRHRKKRNELAVSLFPFLAVLICTLGVLILMLVMAVKSADVEARRAQATDDTERQAELERLRQQEVVADVKLEGLHAMRPDVMERLKQARLRRSHLENEIRKLGRKFRKMGESLLVLNQPLDFQIEEVKEFQAAEAQARLDELQRQITKAMEELDDKKFAVSKQTNGRTQILPYRGSSGTLRKPIFLECTEDAVILQPSGIRLKKSEFVPPLRPGNMIDAALLAIREYYQTYDLAGKEGDPYPLIVVRPDGAETFVLVRNAMKSWDDEFGYELVTGDVELDFGESDSQLAAEIQQVVDVARRRRPLLPVSGSRSGVAFAGGATVGSGGGFQRFETPDARPGLTASDPKGGFVSNQNRWQESASTLASFHQESGNNTQRRDTRRESQSGANAPSTGPTGAAGEHSGPNQMDPTAIARERGAGWALPSRSPGATGYLRPIRVVLGNDYLTINPRSPNAKTIRIANQTSDVVDPMVDEVWRLIDSWGVAGQNGYWKPELRFTVLPQASQRFEELKALLSNSGLELEATK